MGLGGAAFPTHVKLSPPPAKTVDTLILNGVECEPFLTADHRLMLEKAEGIIEGARIILKVLGLAKGFIGIEANKPDAIAHLGERCRALGAPIEVVAPEGEVSPGRREAAHQGHREPRGPQRGASLRRGGDRAERRHGLCRVRGGHAGQAPHRARADGERRRREGEEEPPRAHRHAVLGGAGLLRRHRGRPRRLAGRAAGDHGRPDDGPVPVHAGCSRGEGHQRHPRDGEGRPGRALDHLHQVRQVRGDLPHVPDAQQDQRLRRDREASTCASNSA